MRQGSGLLVVGVAIVGILTGCVAPAPGGTPTPPSTLEPTPTPTPLAAPALPAACSDLVTDADLGGVIGSTPLLAPASSDPDTVAYLDLIPRAGGLVDCTWGTDPESGSGNPGVSVRFLARTAFDSLSAEISLDDCFTYETYVSKIVVTLCSRDAVVNGYYVQVGAVTPNEEDNAEAASRMDGFVGRVYERIAELPAPESLATAPRSRFDRPLCESGPETLATVYGVPASTVFEPGHGSDYGIHEAAAERAGAHSCVWSVGETAGWYFETVPDAAWMFDQESIRTFHLPNADPEPLEAATLVGATAAFAGCLPSGGCVANLLVDGSLVRANGGSSPDRFLIELQKILDVI